MNRHLAWEGTCFRAVREAVAWGLAEALLGNAVLKFEAVALSVGFNDTAAFARAVTRRTGCSPSAYRQELIAVKGG